MASVASQFIEEVTAHAQSYSLEDARELCADGTYFPNNLRMYVCMYVRTYVCMYVCMYYVFMYVCVSMYVCMYQGADKSLARPGREQFRKHFTDALDFNNIETRAVIKFFSCKARCRT